MLNSGHMSDASRTRGYVLSLLLIRRIGVAIETPDGNRTELMTAMRIDITRSSCRSTTFCILQRAAAVREVERVN